MDAGDIRTTRLLLRRWTLDDVPALLALFGAPEVARWTSMPEPLTDPGEAVERIEAWNAGFNGHPALGVWAIVPEVGPEGVAVASGTFLLRPLADSEDIEIGWSLHPSTWGNGYATEAARAGLDRAWANGYQTVRAIMWPDNEPSAAVCRRLGMEDLGEVHDPWYGTPEEPTSRIFVVHAPGT